MTTYINLGYGQGYLNAASIGHIEATRHRGVQIQTALRATPYTFHPDNVGTRDADEIVLDLLTTLGKPTTGHQMRVITLIEGKVDTRPL